MLEVAQDLGERQNLKDPGKEDKTQREKNLSYSWGRRLIYGSCCFVPVWKNFSKFLIPEAGFAALATG